MKHSLIAGLTQINPLGLLTPTTLLGQVVPGGIVDTARSQILDNRTVGLDDRPSDLGPRRRVDRLAAEGQAGVDVGVAADGGALGGAVAGKK